MPLEGTRIDDQNSDAPDARAGNEQRSPCALQDLRVVAPIAFVSIRKYHARGDVGECPIRRCTGQSNYDSRIDSNQTMGLQQHQAYS